jgi:hypothetical protein
MKIYLVLLSISLLASCATISISPISTPNVTIKTERGIQSLISDGSDISCAISGNAQGSNIVFTVSIINKTKSELYFDENDIALEIGNNTKSVWNNGVVYTASQYYKRAQTNAQTSAILMAVAAGLSAANAGRSTSTYSGRVNAYGSSGGYASATYSGQISTYDPAKAQYEIAQARSNLANTIEKNRNYLETLSQTLLYSSEIGSSSIYTGLVFAPIQKAPDVKVHIKIAGTDNIFVFRRSDYEEVINPYIAYQRPKGYVGYIYSPSAPFGISLGWLSNGLSMFMDNSLYLPNMGEYSEDYNTYYSDGTFEYNYSSWEYVYQNESTQIVYDGIIGANYRILPYFWLSGGVGIHYKNIYMLYKEHTIYNNAYATPSWFGQNTPAFEPIIQGGLILGFGPLYLSGNYKYYLNGEGTYSASMGLTY